MSNEYLAAREAVAIACYESERAVHENPRRFAPWHEVSRVTRGKWRDIADEMLEEAYDGQ